MFTKIFPTMYDGTLATKGPWQALVTFQQLLALADEAGAVDMTPEAIARRTTIPLEIITVGIAALEEPDPESRSPAMEGRRIVRLSDTRSWGWRIVNYGSYRAIRDEASRREYMRHYQRDRRAAQSVNNVNTTSTRVNNVAEVSPYRSRSSKPNAQTDGFAEFWTVYPRKVAKQVAIRAWRKLAPDLALQKEIVKAVGHHAQRDEWLRESGKFIPHPATWLNGRRWEDVLDEPLAASERAKLARMA